MRTAYFFAAFGLSLSCGSITSTPGSRRYNQPSADTLFGPGIKNVVIEVDYAPGSEPYTGNLGQVGDVWGLFKANAVRVFAKSPKKLTVPSTLNEMEALHDIHGTSFTSEQILAIADIHRNTKNTPTTASVYVVWLPGYYKDQRRVVDDVIGISIADTGVIAMFKAVVTAASDPRHPGISKFIEQSSLIHEFGHTVGLVNNGIPLTTSHQDPQHGSHCNNTGCAMYWENDGAASASNFANQYVTTGSEVLYGPECLADIDKLSALLAAPQRHAP